MSQITRVRERVVWLHPLLANPLVARRVAAIVRHLDVVDGGALVPVVDEALVPAVGTSAFRTWAATADARAYDEFARGFFVSGERVERALRRQRVLIDHLSAPPLGILDLA